MSESQSFYKDPTGDLCEEVRVSLELETGMNLRGEQATRFDRAFRAFTTKKKITNPIELRMHITSPSLRSDMFKWITSELTVGETFFFRNADNFRALRERVIPNIMETNTRNRSLRIWSAACASGPEPYSIAILLDRHFAELRWWNVSILGTDISNDFLEQASRGRYSNWAFRQTEINEDKAYFEKEEDEFVLNPRIVKQVRFCQQNLVYDAYPSLLNQTVGLDLIVFRNVAIYFRDEITREIIRRFAQCLRPGGWLLIGATEFRSDFISEEDFEIIIDGETHLMRRRQATPQNNPPFLFTKRKKKSEIPSFSGELEASVRSVVSLEKLVKAGLFDEARKHLRDEPDPRKRASIAHELAKGYLVRGEPKRGREMLNTALAEDPLLLEARLLAAGIAEEACDLEACASALKKALYIDPQCLLAHFLLGISFRSQGGIREAARHFRNAEEIACGMNPKETVPHGDGMNVRRLL